MGSSQEKNFSTLLNNWIKENNIDIHFQFKEKSMLIDDESITNMKLVYYYISKKKVTTEKDNELKTSISNHIAESWKIIADNERKELEESGKKTKILKYEITPEMLEYKGYNNTKFKNIEGLYGLMQMN
jgi:hypothetical protein